MIVPADNPLISDWAVGLWSDIVGTVCLGLAIWLCVAVIIHTVAEQPRR